MSGSRPLAQQLGLKIPADLGVILGRADRDLALLSNTNVVAEVLPTVVWATKNDAIIGLQVASLEMA